MRSRLRMALPPRLEALLHALDDRARGHCRGQSAGEGSNQGNQARHRGQAQPASSGILRSTEQQRNTRTRLRLSAAKAYRRQCSAARQAAPRSAAARHGAYRNWGSGIGLRSCARSFSPGLCTCVAMWAVIALSTGMGACYFSDQDKTVVSASIEAIQTVDAETVWIASALKRLAMTSHL
jgi:hypothetical protein